MIPPIIHYCWFGKKPLPDLARKCISSWQKYLPYYVITEWNEDNFDVNAIPYTAEAYQAKKYAFVSDYARFWILYHYGGIYFDTDVEVIRPIDGIISKGPFMACEKGGTDGNTQMINPGLGIGAPSGLSLYQELLEMYSDKHFLLSNSVYNVETIVRYTTAFMKTRGFQGGSDIQKIAGITIYPKEYFCPKDYNSGELVISPETVAIHHYNETWKPWEQRLESKIWQLLGIRRHPMVTWHIDKYLKRIGIKR